MAPQNGAGPKIAPQNDLYTLLLIVAASLLLIGVIFLSVQSVELFGSLFPPSAAN